jgi:hypothetical protein
LTAQRLDHFSVDEKMTRYADVRDLCGTRRQWIAIVCGGSRGDSEEERMSIRHDRGALWVRDRLQKNFFLRTKKFWKNDPSDMSRNTTNGRMPPVGIVKKMRGNVSAK